MMCLSLGLLEKMSLFWGRAAAEKVPWPSF